jgi:hypothetical protein
MNVFTTVHHYVLTWATWIQSIPSHPQFLDHPLNSIVPSMSRSSKWPLSFMHFTVHLSVWKEHWHVNVQYHANHSPWYMIQLVLHYSGNTHCTRDQGMYLTGKHKYNMHTKTTTLWYKYKGHLVIFWVLTHRDTKKKKITTCSKNPKDAHHFESTPWNLIKNHKGALQ